MSWHELPPDTQAAWMILLASGAGWVAYLLAKLIQRVLDRNQARRFAPAIRYRENTWRQL